MNLFEDFISGININNPQFEKTTKVHDWRNYVPYEWQQEWDAILAVNPKILNKQWKLYIKAYCFHSKLRDESRRIRLKIIKF